MATTNIYDVVAISVDEPTRVNGHVWQVFHFHTENNGVYSVTAFLRPGSQQAEAKHTIVTGTEAAMSNMWPTSWFQRLQEALIADKPNTAIYEIAKEGEAERQQLLLAVSQLQDQNEALIHEIESLKRQKDTILGARE